MNKWVEKSINLASSRGYLDGLFEIYPIELGPARGISGATKRDIQKAFSNKNKLKLIKKLLKLSKFPLDDPYIASLRKYPYLLEKNPKTVSRIGKRLFSIGINAILRLAGKPKSPSRQFGNSFKDWLKTMGHPFLEEYKFKSYKGTAFLDGSDKKLKNFAIKNLGVRNLKKGMDFILKVNDRFILGEAKFLTDHGGTQNNQFNDAISVARIKNGNVIGVAILDGIVWFESNTHMYRTVKSLKGNAISALLLKDFIKDLKTEK